MVPGNSLSIRSMMNEGSLDTLPVMRLDVPNKVNGAVIVESGKNYGVNSSQSHYHSSELDAGDFLGPGISVYDGNRSYSQNNSHARDPAKYS